jgi:hypothetical protein
MLRLFALASLMLAAGTPTWAQAPIAEGDEFRVNDHTEGSQYVADVAVRPDGAFVALWGDYGQEVIGVYGPRYSADGVPQGSSFSVTPDAAEGVGGVVAADGTGGTVAVWIGPSPFATGVYARRYAPDGAQLGEAFRVNETVSEEVRTPEVAVAAGGAFVVVWSSFRTEGGYDIYARHYDASGEPQGGEFRVNERTTGNQVTPAVAVSPEGGFVITWADLYDTPPGDVWARLFSPSGKPRGAEFGVNSHPTGAQSRPSIGMAGDGRFVIAWTSVPQDGSVTGVYAQRFAADGGLLGGEFPVNTHTDNYQENPTVAVGASGSFVVTWMGFAQDGSAYGVFAQVYNAAGVPLGEEFQVNTYTQSNQLWPRAGAGGDGALVVVWTSAAQDGSEEGMYGQRYRMGTVSVEASPDGGEAFAVWPNPTKGVAHIHFTRARSHESVTIEVLDMLGRRVALLHEGRLGVGQHALSFDAAALPSGVYFVRAAGGGWSAMTRLVVAR